MRRSHLLLGGALGVHLLLALDGHFYWHDVRYLWATSRFSLGELLAGDWNPERLVILEFPSLEALRKWNDSPEYTEVAKLRQRSARTRAIAVGGYLGS